MKGSAEFCFGWLIDDDQGRLTTCPSFSTENSFRAPNGDVAQTSAGCTMDMALILRESSPIALRPQRFSGQTRISAVNVRPNVLDCPPTRSASTANCRNGHTISRSTNPASGTCRTCILYIRAMSSLPVVMLSSGRQRESPWSAVLRRAEPIRAGAVPGPSVSGRGCKMAIKPANRSRG